MKTIFLAASMMMLATAASAQAVKFTSDEAVFATQDTAGCKANDDMWWCHTNRKPADKLFTDERAELKRVDAGARARFTYVADPSPNDVFASANRAMETGAAWSGDCDDLTMTTLDYLAWDGFATDRMWRVGMVIDTPQGEVEHMVGVVETEDGEGFVIGDVNRPLYPLKDFRSVYSGKAKVTYASRLDQGRAWKPAKINSR